MRAFVPLVGLLLAAAPGLASDDSHLNPVDRYQLIRSFDISFRVDPETDALTHRLIVTSSARIGEFSEFDVRGEELADAHAELVRSDPEYAARNRRAATAIVAATQGMDVGEGRRIAWSIVLDGGLVGPVVERAGPSRVDEVPEWFRRYSPFGDDHVRYFLDQQPEGYDGPLPRADPYLRVGASTVLGRVRSEAPPAARVVYGCGGRVVAAPCEASPEAAAHCRLKEETEYLEQLQSILRPRAEALTSLDPTDLEALADWTDGLWGAMVTSGLAGRIEREAASGR